MKLLLGLFAALAWLGPVSAQTNPAAPVAHSAIEPLGHGVNLGNFLEAPKEGDWGGHGVLTADDFSIIRQAGFTLIRVPIRWASHVSPQAPYTIDPAFFSRIDWVVAQAKQNHLQAILDYHNDEALMQDPEANGDRFVAIWKQIADHFQGAPSSIVFELLNEPNGKLDARHWNPLLARALETVRATNPTRRVVIGPDKWNSIGALKNLVLPDTDRNLIVTVHFYNPMKFTHQGATWLKNGVFPVGTPWLGTPAERQAVTADFDKAAAWGIAHQRPMFLGEFGAFDKGDMASRARWTACVREAAEARGFSWTYWEFCSSFGAYDPVARQWRQPLLDALLPKK